MYILNKVPTMYDTNAAIPPIIKVIKPDLKGGLSTTFPEMIPIEKKDNAVKIEE